MPYGIHFISYPRCHMTHTLYTVSKIFSFPYFRVLKVSFPTDEILRKRSFYFFHSDNFNFPLAYICFFYTLTYHLYQVDLNCVEKLKTPKCIQSINFYINFMLIQRLKPSNIRNFSEANTRWTKISLQRWLIK